MPENDTKTTHEKRRKFLALLSGYGNVSKAAVEAGLCRTALYDYRAKHPAFDAAWKRAEELGARALEDEAKRRAFEGCDRPVYYQGVQCGAVREYSDTLLIVLLKAHFPDKYAERSRNDVNLGGTLKVEGMLSAREAAEAIRRRLETVKEKHEAE
jgi:hypothetical protein